MTSSLYMTAKSILLMSVVFIPIYYSWMALKRRKLLKGYIKKQPVSASKKEKNVEKLFDSVRSSFSTDNRYSMRRFEDAGVSSIFLAKYYLVIKLATFLIGLIVLYFGHEKLAFSSTHFIILAALWLITTIVVPDMVITARIKAQIGKVNGRLPYLLDLMAICVHTGMSLEATIKYLSIEFKSFDTDMAKLLAKLSDRATVVGLEKALDEFCLRVPSPEVRSFAMTLKQSLQYGSSIYQQLTTLAADIRDVNMLAAEERIGKLSAKMSLPLIVLIMMPIVIIILAPAAMRFIEHV